MGDRTNPNNVSILQFQFKKLLKNSMAFLAAKGKFNTYNIIMPDSIIRSISIGVDNKDINANKLYRRLFGLTLTNFLSNGGNFENNQILQVGGNLIGGVAEFDLGNPGSLVTSIREDIIPQNLLEAR